MSKYFDNEKNTFMSPEIKEAGSHMVMTNVHPDVKKKLFNIDTRFQEEYNRTSNITNDVKGMQNNPLADFTYVLPQRISNVKSMKVRNVEIPSTFYPFSLHRKNTFFKVTQEGGEERLITIKDGYYTTETIREALGVALAPLQISFITEGQENSNKFEIINNNANTYIIEFDVNEKGEPDKFHFKSKLGWAMGFRNTSYKIVPYTVIEAEASLNIQPIRYLYVCIDDFSQSKSNSFVIPAYNSYLNSNIIARISIDPYLYKFGSFLSFSDHIGSMVTDTRTYGSKTDIQRLHIQLVDEWGNVMDLNKMDFSFVLEISYV